MSMRLYFSAADGALESYWDKYTFERSLIINTLFQPPQLIPDIFCFISRGLASHVKKSTRQSLLEACIENGIVTPVFRVPESHSFREVLTVIRGKGDPNRAIQGILDSSDEIASRLQFAANNNPNFSPAYWPRHDVGERFEKIVKHCLQCDEPPDIDKRSGINQEKLCLWKRTERWRQDCINEAVEKTREIAGGGLRRGEIWNALVGNLRLSDKEIRVNDIVGLSAHIKPREEKEALRYFWRWICECYHYNQAQEFGASLISFPSYDSLGSLMAISVLPPGSSRTEPLPESTIRERVKLPDPKVLLRTSPKAVTNARKELGSGYLAALEDWQRQPDENSEKIVREALHVYAEEIRREVSKERPLHESILDVVLGAGATPSRLVLRAALATVGAAASLIEPKVAPLVALGWTGYAVYQWYVQRTRDILIELKAPRTDAKVPPEVNLPCGKC